MQHILRPTICLLALVAASSAAEKKFSVSVQAGDFDRRDTVVTFPLPESAQRAPSLWRQGKAVPLQVGPNGRASFIVEELGKGTQAAYELVAPAGLPASSPGKVGQVLARREGRKVRIGLLQAGDPPGSQARPLLEYQAEPGALPRADIKSVLQRGAYLHPISTPSGKIVTDDYPTNHLHHHGVWWSWTKTRFDEREPDFWNMGDAKGRVEFLSLGDTWSGPVHGGFQSQHRFVDLTAPSPVTVLTESWEVIAYAPSPRAGSYWLFDLVSQQQCATASALQLPTYRYGGLGVRGNRAWDGKEHAFFLTSEGETDREP